MANSRALIRPGATARGAGRGRRQDGDIRTRRENSVTLTGQVRPLKLCSWALLLKGFRRQNDRVPAPIVVARQYRSLQWRSFMPVNGAKRIKELFHAAAGLTIDNNGVKRYEDFLDEKLYDLLLMAVVSARANGRDILQRSDLPLTKGLQERMREFEKLAQEIPVEAVLDQLARYPPLDAATGEDVEEQLPAIVGGLSVALAQCFLILEPHHKNPTSGEWNQAIDLFNLLL
jgi:hypothetical protein